MNAPGLLHPPAPPAPWIAEKDFLQLITDLATVFGWEHMHQLRSQGTDPGWPDLVLARPPRLLFVEVKRRDGRLTSEQRAWGETLTACRCDWRCWRPTQDCWDEIVSTLTVEVAE